MSAVCTHLDQVALTELPESVDGCEDCLREGTKWLHLRICLSCGHVGCCDDSPERRPAVVRILEEGAGRARAGRAAREQRLGDPLAVVGHEAIRPRVVLRQAGVHREQLAHGHGRRVRPGLGQRSELRDHVAERRIDVEPALVPQREHRHRHEALRHRANAEGRVGIRRRARFEVARAAPAGVDELAVERDAVGDSGRAELAQGVREEGVDGGCEVAHARGASGVGKVGVHVRGS